jgi:hypothetical protein
MVAAGLTGVYAETIPNLEVLTLVVVLSGVLLGATGGAMVGSLTMLVYSLLNPYGAVHPLVTVAQVAGEALAGLAGGALAALRIERLGQWPRALAMGALAVVVTLMFDLVTNVATGVVFGQLKLTLLGGIPFALWHTGWNVVLFVVLGTPLVRLFAHYRARLSS